MNTFNFAKYQTPIVFFLVISSIVTIGLLYFSPFNFYPSSAEKESLVYFAENMTPAHYELIDLFNRRFKGKIKVMPVDLPYSKFTTNRRKELISRILGNQTSKIDIFAIDHIWMPRFSKWAEPMDQYFNQEELSKILHSAIGLCKYNNVLYGMPFFLDVGILYYRQTMLKAAGGVPLLEMVEKGLTWNEMIEIQSEYFNRKEIYSFQGANYEGLMCNFLEIINWPDINGKSFLGGVTAVNETKVAFRFIHDLIYKHHVAGIEVLDFNENDSFNHALQNGLPFFRGWASAAKSLSRTNDGKAEVDDLRMAPIPSSIPGKSMPVLGGWNLMIASNSKVKIQAAEFVKFLISDEAQQILFKKNGYLPVLTDFYDEKRDTTRRKYFLRTQIENSITRFAHPDYTKISDALTSNLHNYLYRKESLDHSVSNYLRSLRLTGFFKLESEDEP
ncbi:MAG: extracellular solute-binding protein [Ignavibacteriales bacterium]|nr:extracellular solute-binding protein [Ignavibacteriales bacterium]MCF8306655.1 extracellular solute-binding protein [Ignavibacteriales bacterium]MCF8316245.1 extracellular solute-binding protein [Ignavibacteriales bacterium]MCF8437829.1 extracellular solute-binding protein [Ignavibacteriales bacterium]